MCSSTTSNLGEVWGFALFAWRSISTQFRCDGCRLETDPLRVSVSPASCESGDVVDICYDLSAGIRIHNVTPGNNICRSDWILARAWNAVCPKVNTPRVSFSGFY